MAIKSKSKLGLLIFAILIVTWLALLPDVPHERSPGDPGVRLTKMRLEALSMAFEFYEAEKGKIPSADDWRNEIIGTYVDRLAENDYWKNPIQFGLIESKDGYYVWSYGADGKSGGTGEDSDLFVKIKSIQEVPIKED